jgi:glutaredoxin-related protein
MRQIQKHRNKYYLHIQILKYLKKKYNENEINFLLKKVKEHTINVKNKNIIDYEWINIIDNYTNFKNFCSIVLQKNDHGENIRHNSFLGVIIPQEEILKWKQQIIKKREKKYAF